MAVALAARPPCRRLRSWESRRSSPNLGAPTNGGSSACAWSCAGTARMVAAILSGQIYCRSRLSCCHSTISSPSPGRWRTIGLRPRPLKRSRRQPEVVAQVQAFVDRLRETGILLHEEEVLGGLPTRPAGPAGISPGPVASERGDPAAGACAPRTNDDIPWMVRDGEAGTLVALDRSRLRGHGRQHGGRGVPHFGRPRSLLGGVRGAHGS